MAIAYQPIYSFFEALFLETVRFFYVISTKMINECTHNVLADLLTYFLHKCNDALKVRVYDYTPL